jgi:hypothetical protein
MEAHLLEIYINVWNINSVEWGKLKISAKDEVWTKHLVSLNQRQRNDSWGPNARDLTNLLLF